MKRIVLLLAVAVFVAAACNDEAPTKVAPPQTVKVQKFEGQPRFDQVTYKILLPAEWTGTEDQLMATVWHTHNGNYRPEVYISQIEDNYFVFPLTFDKHTDHTVLLRYSNYYNGEFADIPDRVRERFAFDYTVRGETIRLLGFHFTENNTVETIDRNKIIPLNGEVGYEELADNKARYYVNDLEVSPLIGLNEVEWQFPDGSKQYGQEVNYKALQKNQSVMLTITDNFLRKVQSSFRR